MTPALAGESDRKRPDAPRWSELLAAADVIAPGLATPIDPLMIELLRPQAAFNHALIDVLSRWPQMSLCETDLVREGVSLRELAVAPRKIASHRPGLQGELVVGAKRALVPVAERALSRWLSAQLDLNRARVGVVSHGRGTGSIPPVPKVPWVRQWLERQARFDLLLNDELPGILALNSYQAVYERWVATIEQPLPAEREVPDDWLLWRDEGVDVRAGAVASFLEVIGDADLAYADEDSVDAKGQRHSPFFKPGWSPELARERDLLGGVVFARKSVAVGGDPLDWAHALPPHRVVRVPRILSHRVHDADPARHFAAVERALKPGERIERHAHGLRIRRPLPPSPLVSIIVPFRDKPELLLQLFASVAKHPPGVDVDWVLVDNGSVERREWPGARVVRDDGDFNFSRLNNLGAAHARGDWLLFLNNDVEAASDGWLSALLEYAAQDDVAVVGANLWYPDGTLQHSGMVVGLRDLAGHPFARHHEELGDTPLGSPFNTREVTAVTGACMLMRRTRFEKFDVALPVTGGDVELCRRMGRTLNVAHVRLMHHESLSRGSSLSEANREAERAVYRRAGEDEFYNPNLTQLFRTCAPELSR